jgi:hypothetical protein
MSHYGGSTSNPDAFPHKSRHALAVIAALVACDYLPTSNDMKFIGIVIGGGGPHL